MQITEKKLGSLVGSCIYIISGALFVGSAVGGVILYECILFSVFLLTALVALTIFYKKDWIWFGKRASLSPNQRITLLFTLAIVFFTIMQVWVAFYEIIPRVYRLGDAVCLDTLNHAPAEELVGNYSIYLGNYGRLPAKTYMAFKNTSSSLSIIGRENYETFLVPISLTNNEPTIFTFNYKIDATEDVFGFEVNYLTGGSDFLDKISYFLRRKLQLSYEFECKYKKTSDTEYALIKK